MTTTRGSVVSVDALTVFCHTVLTHVGMPLDDAALVVEALLDADLRGVETHGVVLLPNYVRRLQAGGINPQPNVQTLYETPVSALLDGDGGAGHLLARRALERALMKARAVGVGMVSVRNSNHIGMLAHYTRLAAEQGCVGMVLANGGPVMAPWGGSRAMFGTNPLSIGVPADPDPLILDMATSAVARGQIRKAHREGRAIPVTWATGPDGEPTTDPTQAMLGLLLPVGGHKGAGLAVMVELLTGVLGGDTWGPGVLNGIDNPDQPQRMSQFFLVFRTDLFGSADELYARARAFTAMLAASPRRPGVEEILLPGQRGARLARERRQHGVPMEPATRAALNEVADALGLAPL